MLGLRDYEVAMVLATAVLGLLWAIATTVAFGRVATPTSPFERVLQELLILPLYLSSVIHPALARRGIALDPIGIATGAGILLGLLAGGVVVVILRRTSAGR